MPMALETEMQFFREHVAEWLAHHEGKFALVVGTELVDVFDTPESAYESGVRRFGNIPMLIKQIRKEQDEVAYFPALTLGLINARP